MPPIEGGGEMIEHVRWDKTTYNTLPYKFEAGTPNYIGSYAFGKALEYIEKLGKENVRILADASRIQRYQKEV